MRCSVNVLLGALCFSRATLPVPCQLPLPEELQVGLDAAPTLTPINGKLVYQSVERPSNLYSLPQSMD